MELKSRHNRRCVWSLLNHNGRSWTVSASNGQYMQLIFFAGRRTCVEHRRVGTNFCKNPLSEAFQRDTYSTMWTKNSTLVLRWLVLQSRFQVTRRVLYFLRRRLWLTHAIPMFREQRSGSVLYYFAQGQFAPIGTLISMNEMCMWAFWKTSGSSERHDSCSAVSLTLVMRRCMGCGYNCWVICVHVVQ